MGKREAIKNAKKLYSAVSHKFPYEHTDLDMVLEHLGLEAYLYDPEDYKDNEDVYLLLKNSSGFLVRDSKTIYVNMNEHPVRQRFTIAHEIAHYYLGHENSGVLMRTEDSSKGVNLQEIEANAFAAELLMPENLFKAYYIFGYSVDGLASKFGVSTQAVRHRIANLSLG